MSKQMFSEHELLTQIRSQFPLRLAIFDEAAASFIFVYEIIIFVERVDNSGSPNAQVHGEVAQNVLASQGLEAQRAPMVSPMNHHEQVAMKTLGGVCVSLIQK